MQKANRVDAPGKSQIIHYFSPFIIDVRIRVMCPVRQLELKPDVFRCGAEPDVFFLRVLPQTYVVAPLDRIQSLLVYKSGRYSVEGQCVHWCPRITKSLG